MKMFRFCDEGWSQEGEERRGTAMERERQKRGERELDREREGFA